MLRELDARRLPLSCPYALLEGILLSLLQFLFTPQASSSLFESRYSNIYRKLIIALIAILIFILLSIISHIHYILGLSTCRCHSFLQRNRCFRYILPPGCQEACTNVRSEKASDTWRTHQAQIFAREFSPYD